MAYSFLGVFCPLQCATDWACWISLVLAVGKGFTSSGSSVKYLWHHDLTHVFRIALRHETWVAYNTAGPVAVLIAFFSVLVLWIGPFWGSVSRTRRGSHGLTCTPCSDLQGIWSPLLGLVGLAIGIYAHGRQLLRLCTAATVLLNSLARMRLRWYVPCCH